MERRRELTVKDRWGRKGQKLIRQNRGRYDPDKLRNLVFESGIHQADSNSRNEAEREQVGKEKFKTA
jgi:hypothetical protein